jgi:hypothetical protein
MKTIMAATLTWIAALALVAGAGPLREVEITPDPEDNGQQVFTVRLKPGETRTYDLITFACVYHQEFIRQSTDAGGTKGVNEPATFTYRRKAVKLVDDLDTHVSFRVPMGIQKLQDMYGQTTFQTNAPITIARITITASTPEGKAWSFELAASGLHTFDDAGTPHQSNP